MSDCLGGDATDVAFRVGAVDDRAASHLFDGDSAGLHVFIERGFAALGEFANFADIQISEFEALLEREAGLLLCLAIFGVGLGHLQSPT